MTPAVASYATPVLEGLAAEEVALEEVALEDLNDAALEEVIPLAYGQPEVVAQIAMLLSDDVDDGEDPRSRAGILAVFLRHDLTDDERMDAALAVREVVGSAELGDLESAVFSNELLRDELEGEMADELPLLMASHSW